VADEQNAGALRVLALTTLAMLAFASNSLLCRLALRDTDIDAASFTSIRIASGALMLCAILVARARERAAPLPGSWASASALFVYAAAFSFAYVALPAGTGALLLFGAVQATMILWGLRAGDRLNAPQLGGLLLAIGGLVALVFPGIAAPPLGSSVLMISAGVAWGVYSLRGKGARDPIGTTAGNFLRAVPFAVATSAALFASAGVDTRGAVYAVLSGAIASGLGYAIWYTALPALRATSAATVQLSVPVIAAAGGILLLGEPLTLRFVLASVAVLGGIALVIGRRAGP
jgi:drug/metabolite transporter (DMT)-like permease